MVGNQAESYWITAEESEAFTPQVSMPRAALLRTCRTKAEITKEEIIKS